MKTTFRSGRILGSRLMIAVAVTITASTIASAGVVISEFRTRGPSGGVDEFVELYNNSDSLVDISGWKINASNSVGTTGTRVTINAGTTIPARGHFLAVNSTPGGYSGSVAGNQTYTTGITDDGGIALLMPDDTIVDQVGMSTGSAYKEGTVLNPLTTSVLQSYERKGGGGLGSTQDTNNNANDFQLRDASFPPQPQNLNSAVTPPATALVVTDCGDSGGANQLRQKIVDAQTAGGANITFTCGPTIVLDPARGYLPIQSNIFIDGANNVEISGNNLTRVFFSTSSGTLVLKNISVTHGYTPNNDVEGGGVLNYGIVSVSNSHFLFNSTTSDHSGSAIYSQRIAILTQSEFANNTGGGGVVKSDFSNAKTTATGCSFHDNQSDGSTGGGYGGAIQIRNAASMQIANSTFTNNSASFGGAIYFTADSTLTVEASNFTGNHTSADGGAIRVDGAATIRGTTFANNQSSSRGGAIYASANSTLSLRTSTFTGNSIPASATGDGGAIYNDGSITLEDVTLNLNSANSGMGGAIRNEAHADISNTTFNGNTAAGGGALLHDGSGITGASGSLTNVTFSGNSVNFFGGGAVSSSGNLSLVNVTLTGNSAGANQGGGLYLTDPKPGVPATTLKNTLVANSSSGGNCGGNAATSLGGNLSNDTTCTSYFNQATDKNGAAFDPLLGPLANNGGFTQTHLPGSGSPAINGGISSFDVPSRDQRSFVRDATPDVGAVEVGGTLLPAPTSVVSMKNHGGTDFGINLPLTGNGAIECRTGGATGNHQIVLNFPGSVALTGASLTKGVGSVSSYTVNGSQVTVSLTGVTNAQNVFVTLFDVSDGTNLNDITVPVSFLAGDTTANGAVNSSDIALTQSKSGQSVDSTNFREDVTVNGSINSSDIAFVQSKSGTAVPSTAPSAAQTTRDPARKTVVRTQRDSNR